MTSGGSNLNDFPEIVPTGEITTKIEKTFLVFASTPWPWAHLLNGLSAAASVAPMLIRHWQPSTRWPCDASAWTQLKLNSTRNKYRTNILDEMWLMALKNVTWFETAAKGITLKYFTNDWELLKKILHAYTAFILMQNGKQNIQLSLGLTKLYHLNTIRDAILTCARKPTWVSLIYRTETTTKSV